MENKHTPPKGKSPQSKPNLKGKEWRDKEWSDPSFNERFLGLLLQVLQATAIWYCKRTTIESVRKRQTTSKVIAMLTELQRISDATRSQEKENEGTTQRKKKSRERNQKPSKTYAKTMKCKTSLKKAFMLFSCFYYMPISKKE